MEVSLGIKNRPQISPAEWRVMSWLWEHGPATANEVIAGLEPETSWNHRTIRTLLSRLVAKGAAAKRRGEREQVYSSKVSQRECVRAESRSFLARVFGGALAPALATFLEDRRLSASEIEELRALLDEQSRRS
jgi:BlaI family penicillinase repressor